MGHVQSNIHQNYQEHINNVVIIDHTTIKGDVTGVSLVASTDGTCQLVNQMDSLVDDMLSDISQQKNKAATDLFGGFQVSKQTNVDISKQSTVNNLMSINKETCSSDLAQSASDNFVYVTNSQIGGNFSRVTSKTDAKFNCTLSNIMKNVAHNEARAKIDTSNNEKGIAATLGGGVILCIIMIAMCYFVYKILSSSSGKIRSLFSGSSGLEGEEEEEQQQQQLAEPGYNVPTAPMPVV